MATAKPRFEQQTGEWVREIEFTDGDLATLKSIRNDENFVNAIRNIATLYVCLRNDEAESLNSGEIKATVKDLLVDSTTLCRKIERIPQEVDVLLWTFNHKHGSTGKLNLLTALLAELADELDEVLDNLPAGKPGRGMERAKRYAAKLLTQCFDSFGIPLTENKWQKWEMSPETKCLEIIFFSDGTEMSKDGLEAYFKLDQEK